MVLNRVVTSVKKFELLPGEGWIVDYKIMGRKADEEGGEVKLGYEKLALFIENPETNKEQVIRINMGNTNSTNWEEQRQEDKENGIIGNAWVPRYYVEYAKLKIMAENAGVMLIEDIEDIPPEKVEEGKPVIQILAVLTDPGAPDLRDMYIKVDVEKRTDKNDPTKVFEGYVIKYLNKDKPVAQKSLNAFGGNAPAPATPATAPVKAPEPVAQPVPTVATVATPAAPAPAAPERAANRKTRVKGKVTPIPAEPAVLEIDPETVGEVYGAIGDFIDGLMNSHSIDAIGRKLLITALKGSEWTGAAKTLFADSSNELGVSYLNLYLDAMINDGMLVIGSDGLIEFPAGLEAQETAVTQ